MKLSRKLRAVLNDRGPIDVREAGGFPNSSHFGGFWFVMEVGGWIWSASPEIESAEWGCWIAG